MKALFEELFPGFIHSASIPLAINKLEQKVLEREKLVQKVEMAIALYEATDHKKTPTVSVDTNGKPVKLYGGEKKDAIPYYQNEISKLDNEIDQLQQEVKKAEGWIPPPTEISENQLEDEIKEDPVEDDKPSMSGTGFVTFKSVRFQTAAYQLAILSEQYPRLTAVPAPSISDIIWTNIATPNSWIKTASSVTTVVYITGMLFWAVIIAFIGAVSSLSNLAFVLPFVNSLDPVTYALIGSILPVVVLAIFLGLLPVIFGAVSTYIEKRKCSSDIQYEVFKWYCLHYIL